MKHYAVIGSPIAHSRSPEIYGALFKEYGIDADFCRMEIGLDDLPAFAARSKELDGFAVTMPLKRAVIQYLDELDDTARVCGAVNFVLNSNGSLIGFNTDGGGLADAVCEKGFSLSGKTAVILGRGGAAYAAAFELKKRGVSVTLLVRNRSVNGAFPECILPELPGKADFFINATPLGMKGGADFDDFHFLDAIKPELVFDMVYVPGEKTRLTAAAEDRGITTADGNSMLSRQALRSFEIMTGIHVK